MIHSEPNGAPHVNGHTNGHAHAGSACAPSQCDQAEEAVLGCLLLDNSAVSLVPDLAPADFSNSVRARIFAVILERKNAGKRADPITLRPEFEHYEPITPNLTVPQYLGRLVANPDISDRHSLRDHADIIRSDARKRDVEAELGAYRTQPDGNIVALTDRLRAIDDRYVRAEDRPKPVLAASLVGRPVPIREWELPGLVPKLNVTLVTGDGATGKSTLLQQFGSAASVGRPFLGMETTPTTVLCINAEDSDDELHRRQAAIARSMDLPLERFENLHLLSWASHDAVIATADNYTNIVKPTSRWFEMEYWVKKLRPGLLMLDPLADLFAGDEIKRTQARQFIGMLRAFGLKYRTTICLAAHPSQTGIANRSGSAGSTGWGNSVRSRLYFERMKQGDTEPDVDVRVLNTTKANYGRQNQAFRVRWKDGVFVLDQETSEGHAQQAANVMRAKEVFLAVLSKLARQDQKVSQNPGRTYAPSRIGEHPDAKGVSKKDLTTAMYHLLDGGRIKSVPHGSSKKPGTHLEIA